MNAPSKNISVQLDDGKTALYNDCGKLYRVSDIVIIKCYFYFDLKTIEELKSINR